MKRFIISLVVITIIFSNSIIFANGFQFKNFVFGSSLEQVKELIKAQEWYITSEMRNNESISIFVNGNLLGYKIEIIYSFTPISSKLYGITITFPEYSYSRIKSMLNEKYGAPKKCEFIIEKCIWFNEDPASAIQLKEDFDKVLLSYSRYEFFALRNKEQKHLDSKYSDDL